MTRPMLEVLDLEVPLSVILAQKTATLAQVLALAPGTVIEFDKPVTAPLDLMLQDRRIASGRAVRVGETFGLQVLEVADPRSTVHQLGRSHP